MAQERCPGTCLSGTSWRGIPAELLQGAQNLRVPNEGVAAGPASLQIPTATPLLELTPTSLAMSCCDKPAPILIARLISGDGSARVALILSANRMTTPWHAIGSSDQRDT